MAKPAPYVLLLSPPSSCVEDDRTEQSLGLAYIAALLGKRGYEVAILELTGNKDRPLDHLLAQIPPSSVYGISCFSTTYGSVKRIVGYLRQAQPTAYICVGGPHPSALPDETLRDLRVDSVVVGDGELAFLSIVDRLNAGERPAGVIKGISPRHLDDLPFPCRDLVDQSTFSRSLLGKKTLSLISSRGCKFRCLHCNSVVMGGGRNTVAFRSASNVIGEIRALKENGYDAFRFNDDNFADHPDLKTLLTGLVRERITYRIFSRLEHLGEENVALLAASGCKLINVGLESLNHENLKAIGKGGMLEHLSNLRHCRRYGIAVRVSFMVGLPFDTDETVTEAFSQASTLDFDEFAIYPLLPYPGTRLWSAPARYGYEILDTDFTGYVQMGTGRHAGFVLKHTDPRTGFTFGPADVKRWYECAHEILGHTRAHMSESRIG